MIIFLVVFPVLKPNHKSRQQLTFPIFSPKSFFVASDSNRTETDISTDTSWQSCSGLIIEIKFIEKMIDFCKSLIISLMSKNISAIKLRVDPTKTLLKCSIQRCFYWQRKTSLYTRHLCAKICPCWGQT